MEGLLVLVGLLLLAFPLIALIFAVGARNRVATLEKIIDRMGIELARLRGEFDSRGASVAPLSTAAAANVAAAHATVPIVQPTMQPTFQPLLQPTSQPVSQPINPVTNNSVPPLGSVADTPEWEADLARQALAAGKSESASDATAPSAAANAPQSVDAAPQTPIAPAAPAAASPAPRPVPRPRTPAAASPSIFDSALAKKAKAWLFGGNMVAKIGLLILFFGVSFLLKYVAAQITVPIELRLAGVALADIALLAWAWRIREKRPGISLPVQGAALAILMLVTFGAFKMYHLIPSGMAFGLLFVLTAFTCLLAVLQNAMWLAVFGIAGGFASPILTSSGGGSHIGLFAYYTLLNAGVFAIALKRSWRLLNLISFVFTFLIGAAWGMKQYVPDDYYSVQFFLILFFLFYVAIAVIYARKQAPQLKNYVDATLVFGTPLVAFGLQYNLVKDMPFGLAFSALALGVFYLLLTMVLWQRRGSTLKLLAESFLALSLVFGTLAIPFAFDNGRLTSAAWALEGAGIVWVGLRQRQTLVWVFGLLVQAGAWISFIGAAAGLDSQVAGQSNLWLGFLILAGTAFLMATNFRGHAAAPAESGPFGGRRSFNPIAVLFLALATIWFLAGAWAEIFLRTSGAQQATFMVASALLTAIGLGFIARRMQWQIARYFAVVVQVLAGVILLGLALISLDWPTDIGASDLMDGPFPGAFLIGAGAFFSGLVFHRQARMGAGTGAVAAPGALFLSRALLLWSAFWWFVVVLYSLAAWLVTHYQIYRGQELFYDEAQFWLAYSSGIALSGFGFAKLAQRLQWRGLRWSALPNWFALALSTLVLLFQTYLENEMPETQVWAAYLALWLAAEWLMRYWPRAGWHLNTAWLKVLHVIRSVGPWLLLWPVGRYWIALWLQSGTVEQEQLLADAGWFTSGSWAQYLPVWLMMALVGWLMQRSRAGGWPVAPLAQWYRRRLVVLAALWSIVLVVVWNLTQNGAMAPLPYLPLLNPLDLTTCFAILLGFATYRLLLESTDGKPAVPPVWAARLPFVAGLAVYIWFNLVVLRTVAHYWGVPYQFDSLYASQFVQALMSLVWSATALVLMRRAVTRVARQQWMLGAALLGLVVAKLFVVDLSNVGGIERIVSFVGVGLLMVAIGYLAPYPAEVKKPAAADDEPVVQP